MRTTLNFQLLGTRGSRPILARDFIKFGGNTTAYKVWADGVFPIYIDGGSGLFREGARLSEDIHNFTFLLTHSHWDHILAFPFFQPLYRPGTLARFWGTPSFKATFEELFKHQFQTDAFPITYSELPSKITFKNVRGGEHFRIASPNSSAPGSPKSHEHTGYNISTYQINHPGIDLGYRIEWGGKAIVILTDIAPIEGNHLGHGMRNFSAKDEQQYYHGLVDFCHDADLLLHDTHFDEDNIKGKESWGHSTEIMAVMLALKSRVKTLILGHHAPEDSDMAVSRKLERARRVAEAHALEVIIPQEDDILSL
ncbi:MAG: MBL fold metallo-hydrolase [bacterium]|nr:MBL fold metallo-hydrolase [bacterium]